MATKIITKTGSGAPTTSDVDRGELAVDLTNKQLYTNDGSSIIKLGSGSGEGQWSLAPDSDNIYYDSGAVGIGGEPGTRAAADYIEQAKAKIKSWTAAIKTKLDEEPKADKKAVTLEVTDNAFEVIPTEELVAERMAERAIGGGDAKLQVAGDVYATGFAPSNSNSTIKGIYGSSVHIDTGGALQIGRTGAGTNWVYMDIHGSTPSFYPNAGFDFNIGRTDRRFKDAHFSGDVNANRFTSGQFAAPSTTTYFQLNSGSTNVLELRETIFFPYTHDYTTLGRGDKRWKDAYFSGTIYGDVDGAFLRAETIVQDGAPVVDSLQIIRAFMKLRDAVDDPDSSVEELRDKLKVAVVDIIDQFQDLVDSVEPDRER